MSSDTRRQNWRTAQANENDFPPLNQPIQMGSGDDGINPQTNLC